MDRQAQLTRFWRLARQQSLVWSRHHWFCLGGAQLHADREFQTINEVLCPGGTFSNHEWHYRGLTQTVHLRRNIPSFGVDSHRHFSTTSTKPVVRGNLFRDNKQLRARLDQLSEDYDQSVREQLEEGASVAHVTNAAKRQEQLEAVVIPYNQLRQTLAKLQSTIEVAEQAQQESTQELEELARQEIQQLRNEAAMLEEQVVSSLLPGGMDSKDVLLEVKAGVGGQEGGLFAKDLMDMYCQYADQQGWEIELMSVREGAAGGYMAASALVKGTGVYGQLKFESGVHRVQKCPEYAKQRVPDTESAGRIHTSAASVIVMPNPDPVDIEINKSDIKVETMLASGPGGQHVNKTESAVRLTHVPTGIHAHVHQYRDQLQNRAKAMELLRARIFERQRQEQEDRISSHRKSLVKFGNRNERIRTYNFPHDRVTDHRLGLTMHGVGSVLAGDGLETLIAALAVEETSRLLTEAQLATPTECSERRRTSNASATK